MDHFAPLSKLAVKACAYNGSVCPHCGRPDPKVALDRSRHDYECPCGALWRSKDYQLTPIEYAALMSEGAL